MTHPLYDLPIPHTLTTVEGRRAIWIAGPTCTRHDLLPDPAHPSYPDPLQHLASLLHGRTDTVVCAWLVLEPPVSPSAPAASPVAIWALGAQVAHLPRDLAARWHPLLARLTTHYAAPVACQATLDPPSFARPGRYGLVAWLPPLPAAPAPPPQPAPHRPPPPAASPILAWLAHPDPGASPRPPPTTPGPVSSTFRDLPGAPAALAPAPASAPPPKPPPAPAADEELARLRAQIDTARRELTSVEEALEIQSFGFYKPRYGFESSAQYTARLASIREDQKRMIAGDKAAACETQWTVGGSAAAGRKMVQQQAKLMLRAFNGECDAAIAKVRYDNVVTLEERLTRAYEAINKLGEVQRVFISRRYLDLKLAELHLVHEHREKVQEEKEEQKRIREQMREEQKVQAEIERAKAEAEEEERRSVVALEKARQEMERARREMSFVEEAGKQNEKLASLVERLESDLKDALDRKAKAIARAQLTKSGHVYVLSNVGSFGEGIYKIGMTRRLDPFERVDELGSASVPFPFDVHAVIFAEDAPGLEGQLHKAFADRRVNLVNLRKEYFRVSLDEIRAEVERLHGLVSFLLVPEAEELRKTLAAASVGAEGREPAGAGAGAGGPEDAG